MMELINYKHSTKDIPVPSFKVFMNMFIVSIETFVRKVELSAFHFLHPTTSKHKETYGFPSIKNASDVTEIIPFKNDLLDMTRKLEFRKFHSDFQNQLKNEIVTIKNDDKVIVAADKTSNHFRVEPDEYNELIKKEVTKDYKKAKANHVKNINNAHKIIVNKLEIEDRVFKNTEREAFVNMKDHKPGFINNPKCRMLVPSKVEIGKISHRILKNVVNVVKEETQINQWKNTYTCIEWFKNIKNKDKHSFLVFDIVSFYPSITEDLLNKALNWASNYTTITVDDREIILESRRSFLVFKGEIWTKKENPDFDVPMGAYDGAEVCDIVGLFLLSELRDLKLNLDIGGYKDDFLGVSRSSPRQVEIMKKKITQVFRSHGLEITSEANKKIVQFLDVQFNLQDGSFKPYLKEGDTPLYVNAGSNHPPLMLKNIPASINRRLSALSSSEELFNSVSPTYQQALHNAGYSYQLKYDPPTPNTSKKGRQRKRKIIWWNPPFSLDLKTRVGDKFFKLLEKHFPKDNPLSKIFNRNTIKMSYRTTPNMKAALAAHNKKLLGSSDEKLPCNCDKGKESPFGRNGDCRLNCVIYKASVVPEDPTLPIESYVGMTEPTFKKRFRNHTTSFNRREHESKSALSKHIWALKDKNVGYRINWSIIDRAPAFSPVTGVCKLCTLEKFYILFRPDLATLNEHHEVYRPCYHKPFMLLDKT